MTRNAKAFRVIPGQARLVQREWDPDNEASVFEKGALKFGFWPLVLLWLAAHALLLGLILGVKFLTVKAVALLFLAGTAVWLLFGRKRAPSLPAPPGMV